MDDMDVLRALVHNQALVPVSNHNGRNTIKLQESGDRQQGYAIEIKNVPDEIIAINLDSNFPQPGEIFNGNKGECKRADFVLFANGDNDNWIVYIEMQRGNYKSREEIHQQLRGAQCFVVYCRAIGEIFWKQQRFLQNWKERFVSIKNISMDTQETRSSPSKLHDKPEKMLTISAPGKRKLQFLKLVSKP